MTREEALTIAERSADVAWRVLKGPKPFGWVESVDPAGGLKDMCEWVERHPDRPAPELYRHATRAAVQPAPWLALDRCLRVSIEIFRATYAVLLLEVHAADVARRRSVYGPGPGYAGGRNVLRFTLRKEDGGDAA